MLIITLLLALSVSVDAFGIGVTYGLRKIKIPLWPKAIIFMLSLAFSGVAMFLGSVICSVFPPLAAKIIGNAILFFMGLWIIYQSVGKEKKNRKEKQTTGTEKVLDFMIKPLGITVQIIKNPTSGDLNKSSSIDPIEALYLGTALSIDCIGAGVGAVAGGASSLLYPLFVAGFQMLLLTGGSFLGRKLLIFDKIHDKLWMILSGLLLMIIAAARMFT